ncbi:MAG: hypothetical protein IPM94_11290 [bacterium]|nr:hypothetical protein [bacterium]
MATIRPCHFRAAVMSLNNMTIRFRRPVQLHHKRRGADSWIDARRLAARDAPAIPILQRGVNGGDPALPAASRPLASRPRSCPAGSVFARWNERDDNLILMHTPPL